MDETSFIDKYCRSVDVGEARRIVYLKNPITIVYFGNPRDAKSIKRDPYNVRVIHFGIPPWPVRNVGMQRVKIVQVLTKGRSIQLKKLKVT